MAYRCHKPCVLSLLQTWTDGSRERTVTRSISQPRISECQDTSEEEKSHSCLCRTRSQSISIEAAAPPPPIPLASPSPKHNTCYVSFTWPARGHVSLIQPAVRWIVSFFFFQRRSIKSFLLLPPSLFLRFAVVCFFFGYIRLERGVTVFRSL